MNVTSDSLKPFHPQQHISACSSRGMRVAVLNAVPRCKGAVGFVCQIFSPNTVVTIAKGGFLDT